jgi:hypothetical protein
VQDTTDLVKARVDRGHAPHRGEKDGPQPGEDTDDDLGPRGGADQQQDHWHESYRGDAAQEVDAGGREDGNRAHEPDQGAQGDTQSDRDEGCDHGRLEGVAHLFGQCAVTDDLLQTVPYLRRHG